MKIPKSWIQRSNRIRVDADGNKLKFFENWEKTRRQQGETLGV